MVSRDSPKIQSSQFKMAKNNQRLNQVMESEDILKGQYVVLRTVRAHLQCSENSATIL